MGRRCPHVHLFSGECGEPATAYVAEKGQWYCLLHAAAWREWSAAMKAHDPARLARVFPELL